jgi:Sec-independent protein translocase protein TatA
VKDLPLFCIGVVQTIIFAFQLIVFGNQAKRLRQTVEAAKEQSGDMKESIKQATRAADAMQISSKAATIASQAAAESVIAVRERTAQQMRAYLSVKIGTGVYQDANLRFEVRPILINTEHTPAHNVRYAARADVLPWPLPNDFIFQQLEQPQPSFGVLAPQQDFTMGAWVDRRYDDDNEAEAIKRGIGRRLYIWGTVTYDDVFGEQRYTNFAQNIFWVALPDGSERILGNYVDRHNDAT